MVNQDNVKLTNEVQEKLRSGVQAISETPPTLLTKIMSQHNNCRHPIPFKKEVKAEPKKIEGQGRCYTNENGGREEERKALCHPFNTLLIIHEA